MHKSEFSKDISFFLYLLFKHKVRYLIVGGRAVIYYGYARLTGDIDIFYDTCNDNVENLYNALEEFWDSEIPGIKDKKDLQIEDQIIQYGVPPNRIDLMGKITGIAFEDSWKNRKEEEVKSGRKFFKIYYVGLADLIKNKENILRDKDKEDLKYLYEKKKLTDYE